MSATAYEIIKTPEPGVYYVNGQTWSVRWSPHRTFGAIDW
jgi:hypothetical protein